MPTYTRYIIEVETKVRVRRVDGLEMKPVTEFTVAAEGTADSDQRPLKGNIMTTVGEVAALAMPHAAILAKSEQGRNR